MKNLYEATKNRHKIIFFLILLFLFNSSSVVAATKDDVLATVVNFLEAQKNCNAVGMINNSQYFLKIENLKESYTRFCNEDLLQEAKITNLSLINNDIALVSIQSTHKNRINVRTSPVIKVDGQWKIVLGIPPSGVVSKNDSDKADKQGEINQLFKDYVNAIRENDTAKIKSLIKVVPDSNTEKIEKHLKGLSQQPVPQVNTSGISMISDSFAVIEAENKFPNHSYTQKLAVFNENGQWKIIFGHPLTNSSIPKNGNPVYIK